MDYQLIKNWPFQEVAQTYDERDSILYALGIGLGADPLDRGQLRYTLEEPKLDVVPSMASILAHPGFWIRDPKAGVDWVRAVHAEEVITFHEPLPAAGTITARTRVKAIVDKGPSKGAIVYTERVLVEPVSGRQLATVEESIFCRGDGGLTVSDDVPGNAPRPVPDGDPDAVWDCPTMPQQALLYRLAGDRNPLHASPTAAADAGFERPILHGLATFGIAAHAVLRIFCDYEPGLLSSIGARFSAPVFPGETLRVELWRRDDTVLFQATAVERGVVALTGGCATVAN